MAEIEVRGKDIEEAVALGLNQLGLDRDDVIIDILDEGSKGFLGLGGREAVIKITTLKAPAKSGPTSVAERAAVVGEKPADPAETTAKVAEPPLPRPVHSVPADSEVSLKPDAEQGAEPDDLSAAEIEVIIGLVKEMLVKMAIEAEISTSFSEPDDMTGRRLLIVAIEGENLASIIGPRGEALNALQYILRLIAGHRLQRRANFLLDVGGYRDRRRQALTRLAERMAKKATQRRRPVTLEPMPPFERRIIHMALRGHDNVYTQSVGEGDRRKVRVYPNRENRRAG